MYVPQGDQKVKGLAMPQWLLLGDFNLIYREQDKNNGRLNHRLMTRFRRTLNFTKVKEIEFIDGSFTWNNNRPNPTLTHIDRMFYTPAWGELFLNPVIQPLSLSTSDQCPLILVPLNPHQPDLYLGLSPSVLQDQVSWNVSNLLGTKPFLKDRPHWEPCTSS
jgi:hypothetical protein